MSCLIINISTVKRVHLGSTHCLPSHQNENSERQFQLIRQDHCTSLIYSLHHGSGLRQINLSRPSQIIMIPIPARTAYSSRLLDIVDICRGRTAALSLSAATRAAASNWGPVADVRRIATAPCSGKSEYSPQPEDEEGPCDGADNDTRNSAAGDRAWAIIAA